MYEIIKKLADVPIYKICKLPKVREDSDESCPKHTKVVHQNMLLPLDWTEAEIPEDRNNTRHPDQQASTEQIKATDKTKPVKMLVYNLWGMAVRMSHSVLGWWR